MGSPRRAGRGSLRFKKAWSPPSRDPRFSRYTPDRLRDRVAAGSCTAAPVGDVGVWATRILHTKARKTPIFNPERAQLLALLEERAEAVEGDGGESGEKVNMASPAATAPVARVETENVQEKRAVSVREGFPCNVGSPVVALGPLVCL